MVIFGIQWENAPALASALERPLRCLLAQFHAKRRGLVRHYSWPCQTMLPTPPLRLPLGGSSLPNTSSDISSSIPRDIEFQHLALQYSRSAGSYIAISHSPPSSSPEIPAYTVSKTIETQRIRTYAMGLAQLHTPRDAAAHRSGVELSLSKLPAEERVIEDTAAAADGAVVAADR